jgi:hypothetical protein
MDLFPGQTNFLSPKKFLKGAKKQQYTLSYKICANRTLDNMRVFSNNFQKTPSQAGFDASSQDLFASQQVKVSTMDAKEHPTKHFQ